MKIATGFALISILAASPCAFAQEAGNVMYQTQAVGPVAVSGVAVGSAFTSSTIPVKGAPYSATITNESVQTLADGNRIVQTSTGTTARDSQGRTRQDTVLPTIGNLSPADAPHLVFISDPVAQTSYTLNVSGKTAQKMPELPMPPSPGLLEGHAGTFIMRTEQGPGAPAMITSAGPVEAAMPVHTMTVHKLPSFEDQAQVATEDLGTQTMEGVIVTGVRTTHTIPAGQIGNDRAIVIITEVWTSPDLKTIVSSKRSDPRMGEQTFKLTNLVRAEPDASLFTVPPDFKLTDGPQHIMYRSNR